MLLGADRRIAGSRWNAAHAQISLFVDLELAGRVSASRRKKETENEIKNDPQDTVKVCRHRYSYRYQVTKR